MALFEDETLELDNQEEFFGQQSNSYLRDSVKGLQLVRTILHQQEQKNTLHPRTESIRHKIPALLAGLELEKEAEFYQRLSRLDSRMNEQEKVSLLNGKVVLGIGGRFSAGKSCFINSISNADLPEEQRETTSISTYVIHSETKCNIALTTGGGSVKLDDEAVQALTHQFYEIYHIGFSRVIQNLAICSPAFRYPNIAILDTPGYNKADTGKMKEATDAENARRQLKSVDYMIWLVDIENGELKIDDEKFIDSLNISTPILIIFNKAGTVLPEKAESIVANTSARLEADGRNIFAVIAYDSWEKKTVVGSDALDRFLDMVDQASQKKLSLQQQINSLRDDICNGIDKQIETVENRRKKMEKSLIGATDAKSLGSLIAEYIACGSQKKMLQDAKYSIIAALDN